MSNPPSQNASASENESASEAGFGLKRPAVDERAAEAIARERFGLESVATELGSNQDRNHLLRHQGTGAPLGVLKVDNPVFAREELTAQCVAADALAAAGVPTARFRPGIDGEQLQAVTDADGTAVTTRLMEFLPGGSLVDAGYLGPAALASVGELAGRADAVLAGLSGPGLERELQWDLRRGLDVVHALVGAVPDDGRRAAVRDAADGAWARIAPLAHRLPVRPIHGDLTDDNIIAVPGPDGRPLAGAAIDLGDLALGWGVAEIAVTVSSLLHHRGEEPLACLGAVRAYARQMPLNASEAEALWPLVVLRAAVLIASGWEQTRLEGDNDYAAERMDGEWAIFEAATSVPLEVGIDAVRIVLAQDAPPGGGDGTEASSARADAALATDLGPLLDPAPRWHVLDLGVESSELCEGRWMDPGIEPALIETALGPGQADAVAIHALDPRLSRTAVASASPAATVPLGTTIVSSVPRELLAPAAGEVLPSAGSAHEDPTAPEGRAHSDRVEPGRHDVTLRLADGSRLELRGVARPALPGPVAAGAPLGLAPGGAQVSVLLAQADAPAELPEFVVPAHADPWRRLVLDPAPLLGLAPLPSRRTPREEAERRRAVQSSAQEKYYVDPPQIERGWRHHLVDTGARAYVDLVNNVTGLGHSHPAVASAATRQLGLLNTNSRFLYESLGEYARRLVELAPEGLDTVLFVNSGSEAVDLALKVARAATGKRGIAALREAYHGWTLGADAVTTSAYDSPHALDALSDWVHVLPVPNPLRGEFTGPGAGPFYARDAADRLGSWAAEGAELGAFICESVLGNAGGVLLPDGYLDGVYRAVRERGGVCIADEVQVGFGRMGERFWGFELQGVVPDIITIAKPMGNGFPIGAVITRRELAEALGREGMFFSSAGGSPLSCAVGLAVLDTMEAEGLQENARVVGARLRDGLQGLVEKYPLAAWVHGTGLYLGLELVKDRDTLEPAAEATASICERLLELGVIVQPTSERQNVLKIKPPLCLTEHDADFAVAMIDRVLREGW